MDALDEMLALSARVTGTSAAANSSAERLARAFAKRSRSRMRARHLAAAILAGTVLVSGGAISAAAQSGWIQLPWVDGADKNTSYRVTLSNGHVYDCPTAFHVQGDYGQSASYAEIQNAVAEGKAYVRTTDLHSLKPDLQPLEPAPSDNTAAPGQVAIPDGLTPEQESAQKIRQGWTFAVIADVNKHLRADGLPRVSFQMVLGPCERASH